MAGNYVSSDGIESRVSNPFVRDLLDSRDVKERNQIIKGKKGWATKTASLVDPETGEIISDSLCLAHKTPVDRGKFIKIFVAGLQATFDLSTRARKAFSAMMEVYSDEPVGSGQRNDMIIFNHKMALDSSWKPSRGVFRSAMNELCLKKFLCPVEGTTDWYWTNPTFFHRGDRLVIVNHYVLDGDNALDVTPQGDTELDQMDFDGLTERERRFSRDR